jgi:hypothetical protein
MEDLAAVLDRDLAGYNLVMREMLGEIATLTVERFANQGVSTSGSMTEVDEYGRSATQVEAPPSQVAFPLRKFQYAVGWTKEWESEKTPADFARMTQAGEVAHRKRVMTEIKRALLISGNYTFADLFVDNMSLPVKRLYNADSTPIPDGPNGESFTASSHTHYLAAATLTTTAADSLINTVVEHGFGGRIKIYINKADESAWRGLSGFTAYQDPRLILASNVANATQRLDITRLDNRAIGIYGAAEIWVKPWMIADYAFAFDADAASKPLALRERVAGSMNLVIAGTVDAHPLRAQYMEAKFGAGAHTRGNGAVLYVGSTTYADPTI